VLVDEVAYLTNARVLAGGTPGALLDTPFYRGGYSLVLAPLMTVLDDPVAVYHLALAINVMLAASLFPLLYLLLTRCFGVASDAAVACAFAGAAYPSLTVTSGATMSENLLLPLTVVWLLAFGALLDGANERARAAAAVGFGACAAALWAAHGRMIVAVGLSGLALVALVLRRRIGAWAAAGGLACLAVGGVAATLFNDHLIDVNYGGRNFDEAGSRLSGLDNLDGVLTVAGNLVGQTWYLLVATLGLALFVPLQRAWRGPVLALLGLAAVALIAVSAGSFAQIERPDMLIYGRYVEVVAPPLVALGLAALLKLPGGTRVAPLVGAVLALTAVVAGLRHGLDTTGAPSFWNVQSLPLRAQLLGAPSLVAAGVAVAVVIWALVAIARREPKALVPLVVVLFVPTTALAERSLLERSRAVYPNHWQSIGAAVDDTGARTVGYDGAHTDFDGQFIYRWFVTGAVLTRFERGQPSPSRYVISAGSWPREHPQTLAAPLWRDPARDQVLFRLGG
jgi:hypothetical protein